MNHAKTFDAIDKLKEVEAELHRLKNALELANRALEAEREACANVCEILAWNQDSTRKAATMDCAAAIRARGQE
jgi:vacuolar-type H+-ATPase subunit E/Vma4